ncbi:MAG: phenylalanine--tRNA ligase subunit beta, partial [Bacteroidota bacterium]
DEIGLSDTHEGILILDTPLPPGTPVAQHFHIQLDQVLEIDLTPNRGDACSHVGVARDIGAVLDRSIQLPDVKSFKPAEDAHLPLQVAVADQKACPRYAGAIISSVEVQESPRWLKDRLKAISIQPFNNIVDVANFVLHELGQPLHVFDYDQIVGQKLTVQQLQPGTEIVTLDGQQRTLNGEELVIGDQAGPLCLAGILGGERGSIQSETKNIFIESAYFKPSVIRKAAKYHGLKTDAAFRYERGVDPHQTVYALKRACLLIQEVAGGTIASQLVDIYPQEIPPHEVTVRYDAITRLVGLPIPTPTIHQILHRLDIGTSQQTDEGFVATIPPYRADVRREADLVEEILRIYGYDRIEVKATPESTHIAAPIKLVPHKLQHSIATLLANSGYNEIYTNALTQSSQEQPLGLSDKQQNVTILNPLSEHLDALRRTLLFTGLDVVAHNINRKQTDLKLFEFGKTYQRDGQQCSEYNRLGIWLTGNCEAPNWLREPCKVTFQDLNAVIHKVLQKLNITALAITPISDSIYTVGVQIATNQTPLLTAGQVRPTLLASRAINQTVFFADIDWDQLLQVAKPPQVYQAISKFPPVKRDLSLVLDQATTFEAVRKVVEEQNEKLIQETAVFD